LDSQLDQEQKLSGNYFFLEGNFFLVQDYGVLLLTLGQIDCDIPALAGEISFGLLFRNVDYQGWNKMWLDNFMACWIRSSKNKYRQLGRWSRAKCFHEQVSSV